MSVARFFALTLLPSIPLLLLGCGPSVAERRQFRVCVREHYAMVKKVYNRETGEPEYIQREATDPAKWEVVCGLGGRGDTEWSVSDELVVYEDGRLIAKDTPVAGKSVTLDCYAALPTNPGAPRWKHAVWFPTSDGLHCRVPQGWH